MASCSFSGYNGLELHPVSHGEQCPDVITVDMKQQLRRVHFNIHVQAIKTKSETFKRDSKVETHLFKSDITRNKIRLAFYSNI